MLKDSLFTSGKDLWECAKAAIAASISRETFLQWFEDIEFLAFENEVLTLAVATDLAAYWICDNYADVIKQNIYLAAGMNLDVKILAKPRAESQNPRALERIPAPKAGKAANAPMIVAQNTFENFIVGEGNRLAHAAALAVSQMPGCVYNPLLIYGSSGLGKTHLMHAVAHSIYHNNSAAKIVYVSSERFVNEYILAIQENSLIKFRERYRSADVLIVDDIQFLSGKERCQEEFFHAFNELFTLGKQIIISSDRPVNEIPELKERLVSRFAWGLNVDIQAPDYETRLAIVTKKSEMLGVKIPADVLDLLAKKITKNVRQLEGALKTLAISASIVELSLASAEKILKDMLSQEENSSALEISQIQKLVADYFKLSLDDLLGPARPANIAQARQVAMYLSKKLTKHTWQDLGKSFGGRTHGTVMHAVRAVSDAMEQDESLRRSVDYLAQTLSR